MASPRPDGLGEILEDSDLRAAGAAHKVTLTLKIRRYNPEVRGEESWWDEFEIQADPDDRLLDALHQVKWFHDGTRALRRSCAHRSCRSDAMMIDGKNALACKVIVRDIAPKVTVEPIRGLPVLKDLIVDMEPFFAGYKAVLPYLINDSGEPSAERLQSIEDRTVPVEEARQIHAARASEAVELLLVPGSHDDYGEIDAPIDALCAFLGRALLRPGVTAT